MINIEQQENLLIAIGNLLQKKINVYAIGGTAMMLRGIKNSTLDIDIVFESKNDREEFIEALKKLGARSSDATLVYGLKASSPSMFELAESRFDLFLNNILSSVFSEKMKKRADQIHEFKNLVVRTSDLTDILIMKCVTSRAKDNEDIISIVNNHKINWTLFIEEVQEQISLGKENAALWIGEKLESFANTNTIKIPKEVFDKLWALIN